MNKRIYKKLVKNAINALEINKATKEQEYLLVKQFGQEFLTNYYSNKKLVRLITLKGKRPLVVLSCKDETLLLLPAYFNKYKEEILANLEGKDISFERLVQREIVDKYGNDLTKPATSNVFPLINDASGDRKDYVEMFTKILNGYNRYYNQVTMLNLNYNYKTDLINKVKNKTKNK